VDLLYFKSSTRISSQLAAHLLNNFESIVGSCVRTLGGDAKFCDDKQFSNYDPYESVYLNSTDFPLPFIEAGEVSWSPHMTAERRLDH